MEFITARWRSGMVAAAAICVFFLNVSLASGESYRISGSVDGTGRFVVDDALDVYLNGVKIHGDPAAANAGQRSPIPFSGTVGDELRFEVRDTYGDCRSLSRLILTDQTGRFAIAHPGWDGGCGNSPNPGVVHQTTFTIPTLQALPAYAEAGLPGSSLSGLVPGVDGRLYGVTYDGGASDRGTLFAMDPVTLQVAVLHQFTGGSGGGTPYHNLVLDPATGKFYGTTSDGAGTIFSFDPVSNTLTTLISDFGGRSVPQRQLVLAGGYLFGMLAYGPAVFRIATNGSGFTILHEFAEFNARPQELKLGSDGKLYGAVPFEGAICNPNRPGEACGIAFRMNPVLPGDTNLGYQVLHEFRYYFADPCPSSPADPYCVNVRFLPLVMNYPQMVFLGSDGLVYGHTYYAVFRFDPNAPATTAEFLWTDGGGIMVSVLEGADGRLYVTDYGGGPTGSGRVLVMDRDGANLGVLHEFNHTAGTTSFGPYGPLFRNAAGTLFGLTEYTNIGPSYKGVAFVINPAGGGGGGNQPPVADPQTVQVPEDTPTAITLTGGDPEGASITFAVVTNPTSGTLSGTAPNLTYTPSAEFSGSDSFTFKVNDGTQDSAVETVSITVNAVNDAPVAVDDPGFSTVEDTDLQIPAATLVGNDTDVDGGALSVAFVSNPVNGSVTVNAGTVTFTPSANYTGSASFEYAVSDGNGGTDIGLVTIDVTGVNDAPRTSEDTYTTDEDTPLTVAAPGVLANDSDPDNDAMTAVLNSGPPPQQGSLTFNADGSFTFTPAPNTSGQVTFTYKVTDGTMDSFVTTVRINVNTVNDPPVANPDSYSTSENTQLTVQAPGVLSNDDEVDSVSLTALLVTGPANGTLTLNADGSFRYVPTAGFAGADSFTYRANDGSANSNVATVSITVSGVNDPPTADDDAYTTPAGTTLNVAAPGVLVGDTDPDGTALTAVLVAAPPAAQGTLVLNADGSFTFTPAASFAGPASFTYKANDGVLDSNVATVAISVTFTNSPPNAVNDQATVAEDSGPNGVAVLANDSDPDAGQTVSVISVTQGAHGSVSFTAAGATYTPHLNFNGNDSFTYTVSDGNGGTDTATVSVTVTPVNDAPDAVADQPSVAEDSGPNVLAVRANDSDVDGDALTITAVTQPASGGTVAVSNGGATVTFTPTLNFNGQASFTYTLSDGQGKTDTASVAVTVTPVNDAPIAAGDAYTTVQGTVLTVAAPGVLQNDSDVEGASLTAVVAATPANGTLTLNANGSFGYTPNAAFSGVDSFTYRASDGSAQSSPVTVTLTVTPAPAAPAAPTALATMNVSSTQVSLSWSDNSNNEDGFAIERCQGNGNCSTFVQIATVGANVTTFLDTGLTPGTPYSYRVRAFNAAGNSPYSNVRRDRTRK